MARTARPEAPDAASERRLASAPRVLVVGLTAYAVAALLNAPSLAALAARQELGPRREWSLRVVAPLARANAWLRLDRLRAALLPRTSTAESVSLPPAEAPYRAWAAAPLPTTPGASAGPVAERARSSVECVAGSRRVRVWIAGDSMSAVFGRALTQAANRSGAFRAGYESRHSTGLTRPDLFDWAGRVEEVETQQRPDVSVFVFGANDSERLEYQRRAVSIGSSEWAIAYASRVARVMAAATSGGRRALWVGMPAMRSESLSRNMLVLNRVFRAEAARHPGVTFVDAWELFSAPEGAYAPYLPDEAGVPRLVRESDGVHYTRDGAERLTERVLSLLPRACGESPPR